MQSIAETSNRSLEQLIANYERSNTLRAARGTQYMITHAPRYLYDIAEVVTPLEPDARILDSGSAPFGISLTYDSQESRVSAAGFEPTCWLDARIAALRYATGRLRRKDSAA